ncbi:ABC transporter substrate-binding protein [Vineibacter terrae]|uniref:ABC transporter substrate-binding protein n=1 Tax=Vineibacter terrae TaxID=2586908 RepID=UPI002E3824A7|nr:ABC transporter substrate-binding protein [Vineibacter terrae]HEX2890580.1 ABC transporter substrate-binding protein [Vineibacter terrae]
MARTTATALRPTRRMLVSGLAAGTLAMPFVRRARAAEVLYVNTWGGPWEEAARAALFNPFTESTGIEIRTIAPVSFAKLAAQVRTGVYEFDVTTLGVAELGRANQSNLIDKYDENKIPAASLWPGAVTLNGVSSHAFANIIAYRKDKLPDGPQTWADFWDTKKYPGPRSLQNYPARVLAFALMADGVDPAKLFPYDLDRAFKSLDRIKKEVRVWWSQSPQSQQLLRDGEVELIGMWNTSAQVMIDQKLPIALTFNQAVIDVAAWVVARGTPRAKNAWRFIEFAVSPERLAQFAQRNNYGPMNPASFKGLPPDVVSRMPTSPQNLAKAVILDAEKLAPQFATMAKRFEQWLSS